MLEAKLDIMMDQQPKLQRNLFNMKSFVPCALLCCDMVKFSFMILSSYLYEQFL